MRRSAGLLLAVAVGLPAVLAVSSVSPDNLQAIIDHVTGLQDADGLWGDAGTDPLDARLSTTRFAAGVLSLVKGTGLKVVVPQRKEVCVKLVSKGLDLPALHDVIAARSALKCSRKANTKLLDVLQAGLNADALESVFHAAQAGFTLLDDGKITADKLDFSVAVDTVNALRTDTGAFRWAAGGAASDVAAGLALQVLGGAFSRIEALHERLSPEMRKTVQVVNALVARQEPTGAFAGDDHVSSSVHASSTIWAGLSALSSSLEERIGVDDAAIRSLTGFLLQHAATRDLPTLFHVLSALTSLSHNALHVPLVVSRVGDSSGALDLEGTDLVRVSVSNALGGFASAASVIVRSVTFGAGSSAEAIQVPSNARFTPVPGSSTEYEFNLLALVRAKRDALRQAPAAEAATDDEEDVSISSDEQVMGVYSFALNVAPTPSSGATEGGAPLDALKASSTTLRVAVGARIAGLKMSMYTYDPLAGKGENRVGEKRKAVYPKQLSPQLELLTLTPLQNVAIQFQVDAAIRPHQVMVRLMKVGAYEQQLFFVPTFRGAGKFKQGLDVHDAVWNAQHVTSGVYDVSIVVGDANLVQSVAWHVARLQVTVDDAAELPDDDAVLFAPRPEIRHEFGVPDARPSTLFALLYSGVVLLPLLGLVHWLRINGALHFQLPENPKDFLFAVAFLGCLMAALGALVIYWVKLNIFQLGKATVFLLAPALGFTGYQALRAHATEREKMKYQ